jgi:transposase
MFRPDKSLERELFAYTPRDLLPEKSDVYLYIDLFDQLDLEEFYMEYSNQGQDSVDPRLMLRTIFYGLTHGVASGRKLETACTYDARYMVLCGTNRPSYRTFSRFIERHQHHLNQMFVQVVRFAQVAKLAKLGRVAIDGTRIKGYTSNHRTMKAEKFDHAIEVITKELEGLKEELKRENKFGDNCEAEMPKDILHREKRIEKIKQAKARLEREAEERGDKVKPTTQVSFNDTDARSLGSNKEKFIMGYNCQAIADEENQIILAAEICDNTNDSVAFCNVVDAMTKNCDKVPDQILADAGYMCIRNLDKANEVGSEAIFSDPRADGRERLEHVVINEDGKTYSCKSGIKLKYTSSNRYASKALSIRVPKDDCESCPLKDQCYLYTSGKKTLRIYDPAGRQTIMNFMERSKSEEFAIAYRRRKAIIEPIFANIKTQKRFLIYRVGKAKVDSWWKMVCTALNIEKIIRAQVRLFKGGRGAFFSRIFVLKLSLILLPN